MTEKIRKNLLNLSEMSVPIRLRLFMLLAMLVAAIIFAVLVILSITGTFSSGVKNTQVYIEGELAHLTEDISGQYERYSAHAVSFAEKLSANIEESLASQGLTHDDLKKDPQLLYRTIKSQYDLCLGTLQLAGSSGTFLILDATVNPNLDNADNSKSGLYIKDMEPNIINPGSSYLLVLRGSSLIGRENSVTLHSQWRMEFDVTDADYFHLPMKASENQDLSLPKLYYWSPSMILPGTTEEIMICSVPLIDSRGNAFGVCGLEVSSMLFKLNNMPDNKSYPNIFCTMSPYNENQLNTSQAFFAGGYSMRNMASKSDILSIVDDEPFNSYCQQDGAAYSGLHQTISLYPKGSSFEDEKWMIALLMPDKDISNSIIQLNLKLLLFFLVLLIAGIVLSYFLSRKFLTPITKSISRIKSKDYQDTTPTNIAEIDDLMDFLSSSKSTDKVNESVEQSEEALSSVMLQEFMENIKTLSPAERAVFNLYLEGYSFKEAAEKLCLSINTIKTHNRRIYRKLKVSSKEELNLYIKMLEHRLVQFTS